MREPVYSEDAEKTVIGGLLISPGTCSEVFTILGREDFYIPELGEIFKVIKDMWENNEVISIITVSERTGKPISLLVSLTDYCINTPTVLACAKIVKEKSTIRQVLGICDRIQDIAYDKTKTQEEIIEEIERLFFNLNNYSDEWLRHIREYINEISKKVSNREIILGYASGFKEIDRTIGGLKGGELVVLAARPGVGKTAMILNTMLELAKNDIPVAIFSLEMDAESIATRLLAIDAMVPVFELRNGDKEVWDKCLESLAFLTSLPIFINDSPLITPAKMRSILRRHKEIKAIFIDYIQLIRLGEENRVQEVTRIVRDLKAIAREFDIPVIAVSQLNRAVEQRQDKRPQLSDLRDSGGIEQEADVVLLLYRDDYYRKDKKTEDRVEVEVEVAKNRNGPIKTVKLIFDKKTNKFEDFILEFEEIAR
ncbi:MAG TPA: replicative DNA helicase [bacterium]|nr:replicative DNA helicase [bacterium]HPC76707.1 replicative DNA helicase [bacterium]